MMLQFKYMNLFRKFRLSFLTSLLYTNLQQFHSKESYNTLYDLIILLNQPSTDLWRNTWLMKEIRVPSPPNLLRRKEPKAIADINERKTLLTFRYYFWKFLNINFMKGHSLRSLFSHINEFLLLVPKHNYTRTSNTTTWIFSRSPNPNYLRSC